MRCDELFVTPEMLRYTRIKGSPDVFKDSVTSSSVMSRWARIITHEDVFNIFFYSCYVC